MLLSAAVSRFWALNRIMKKFAIINALFACIRLLVVFLRLRRLRSSKSW